MKKLIFLFLILLSCSEEPIIHKLIIDVKPINAGIVSQPYGEFQDNEEISLIATSNSEFEFYNWTGDRLHPSGKMYALWVDRVIEYVSNLKY